METNSFNFKNLKGTKSLYCEKSNLNILAKKFGTPLYVYSKKEIEKRISTIQKSLPKIEIYFAVKSNSNLHILKIMKKMGVGADIVSGGELFRAIMSDIPSSKIIYSGVGKTNQEILEALLAEIKFFNVESKDELIRINQIAKNLNRKANILLRFNPNINAKTHPHISTGLRKNKFGLSSEELKVCYSYLPTLKHVQAKGLSCHIGSQITDSKPLKEAWTKLKSEATHAPFRVTHLDLGGGLGISQNGEKVLSLNQYTKLIKSVFKNTNYQLMLEPGRALIGPSCVLLTKLISVKNRKSQKFYIVDAAMNDLIRPSLYGAIHPFQKVNINQRTKAHRATIVGPVCESSDTFEVGAKVPESNFGDLFVFYNSGAYGMSMSSQYNSRPRAAEVLIDGSKVKLIRKRETYADLIAKELS